MKILYIAYSCAPNSGSENKVGWNIPLHSSEKNEVWVITKEEHRKSIEKYCKEHGGNDIHFYYVDIAEIVKTILNGFLYSGRLIIWNHKAYKVAREICKSENIDIIHQVTPVEFRSIGSYWRIPNVQFVCGPVGGGEYVPGALRRYITSNLIIELLRKIMNSLARFKLSISGSLKNTILLYANKETLCYLQGSTIRNNEVCSEVAICESDIDTQLVTPLTYNTNCFVFLVAGRLVYRKGHRLLLDVIEQIPDTYNFECRIVGTGREYKSLIKRVEESEKLSKKVSFVGAVDYSEMDKEYKNANVFIMPSLRETTGAVVLEAMAKGKPVITINRFGAACIIDNDSGWTYDGTTEEEIRKSFANIMMECMDKPELVIKKSKCSLNRVRDYTWGTKISRYNELYRTIVNK